MLSPSRSGANPLPTHIVVVRSPSRVSFLDNSPVVPELNRIIFDSAATAPQSHQIMNVLPRTSTDQSQGSPESRPELNVSPEFAHLARDAGTIDPATYSEFPRPSSTVSCRDLNPLSFDR